MSEPPNILPRPPHWPLSRRSRLWLATAILPGLLGIALPAWAGGVHLDGSFGQSGALPGPNYLIPAEAGKQVGGSLFQSFSQFDLSSGESATFQAPLSSNAAAIGNILARITSGSASSIDGTIISDIAGANLFLINPSGFVFGQHAQLEVSGSFTATSASTVKLADGAHFDAQPGAGDLTLSAAPVASFGFLTAPGAISVASTLSVPSGKTLAFAGGNLSLNNASLTAASGQVALVSRASAGQMAADFSSPQATGAISLLQSSVDTSGTAGGRVVIRGGSLTVDRSTIVSDTSGTGTGGRIDVRIGRNATIIRQSRLLTTTSGAGTAGDLVVQSGSLTVTSNSLVGSQALSGTTASARAGQVDIGAISLLISNESAVSASTFGLGRGNQVDVAAEGITLVGDSSTIATGIFSNTNGSGASGSGGGVKVFATGEIDILDGSSIGADTNGLGRGGDVSVTAQEIYIAAQGATNKTGIFADSLSLGAGGRGGDVHVQALNMIIANGGLISTKTLGLGAGGDTDLNVGQLIIDRNDSPFFTGLAADTPVGGGPGGNVRVFADTVDIFNGGQISANTFTGGAGGSVFVQANDLLLLGRSDFFTGISADSLSTGPGGAGGNVEVTANSLSILEGARISANTSGAGRGGDVVVTAGEGFISGANSTDFTGISAETLSTTATGPGGNVRVSIDDLTLTSGGSIAGNTLGPGPGGGVIVHTDALRLLSGARISADASGSGVGGDISLTANGVLISGLGGARTTGIFSDSLATGQGGNGGRVSITADNLQMTAGGAIGATSASSGDGGSVEVKATQLTLDGGASIAASATGAGMAGSVTLEVTAPLIIGPGSSVSTTSGISDAGTVTITSATDIDLNGGSVTVQAVQGNAGQIVLLPHQQLSLTNSQLLAEAGQNGGDITIDPEFVLLDHSLISANAAAGRGGNITLAADFFFTSETPITATGSQAGTVNIEAPELDLANGLVTLPGGLIDAATQIREQCAQRLGLDFSSFLSVGRGGSEPTPSEAQPAIVTAAKRPPATPAPRRKPLGQERP